MDREHAHRAHPAPALPTGKAIEQGLRYATELKQATEGVRDSAWLGNVLASLREAGHRAEAERLSCLVTEVIDAASSTAGRPAGKAALTEGVVIVPGSLVAVRRLLVYALDAGQPTTPVERGFVMVLGQGLEAARLTRLVLTSMGHIGLRVRMLESEGIVGNHEVPCT